MIITGYFSHPIQGAKGKDATREYMQLNNEIAIAVSQILQAACPVLDLYVPAVHDEIIIELFESKELGVDAILNADKKILAKRDILIGFEYRGIQSNGMRIEYAEAEDRGKPIFVFQTVRDIPGLVEHILDHYYNTHV